jgi:hypothetical protein
MEESLETHDVVFTNNVCEYLDNGVMFLLSPDALTYNNNTFVVQSGIGAQAVNGWMKWTQPEAVISDTLEANNNIAFNGKYGMFGDGLVGDAALDGFVTDWTFTGNVIAALEDTGDIGQSDYPDGTAFITSETLETIFTNFAGRVYCVDPESAYYGKGADCSQIPSLAGEGDTGTPKYRIRFRLAE